MNTTQDAITFSFFQGDWHLRGPADSLTPGSVVPVSKRDGSTRYAIVGEVVGTFDGGKVAVATWTITRKPKAPKKAKARKSAGAEDTTSPAAPSPSGSPVGAVL